MISAPSRFDTSCGSTPLPSDFDILRPSPSTVKPCVSSALYGGGPSSMEAVSNDEWNHPRCWSEPSRYKSAGNCSESACEPRSTCQCVVPESNHTSSVSRFFSYMLASSPSISCGSSVCHASIPLTSTRFATSSSNSSVRGCSSPG